MILSPSKRHREYEVLHTTIEGRSPIWNANSFAAGLASFARGVWWRNARAAAYQDGNAAAEVISVWIRATILIEYFGAWLMIRKPCGPIANIRVSPSVRDTAISHAYRECLCRLLSWPGGTITQVIATNSAKQI
jgi:hypothetical protein